MIGELLASICDDPAVLARFGGPIGEAARDAAAELASLPPDDARAWRVRITAALRAPIPPGIRGAHPSWIEAGLVELPPRARTAVAGGSATPVDVWLARWATSAIPPLPGIDPAIRIPSSIEELVRMSPEALTAWLTDVGADQLAFALAGQPDALRAISRVAGPRVIHAVTRIGQPPRAGALGHARDAIARCRVPPDTEMLIRIGARALAPHTDALSRRQLVVRFPKPRGEVLLGELASYATTPLERAPSWAALTAD